VASRRSGEALNLARGDGLAFGMTPVAIAPKAQISSGERKPMHTATKRTLVAAAALAAAGLFGSLPYPGTVQAQGVPIQHHDLLLVDSSDILGPETTFDTTFFNDVLGSGGAEEQFYNSVVAADGATAANTLLDTDGASPLYNGIFNGAESRIFEGLFVDTLASEDQVNQLLGVSTADSQTAILGDLTGNSFPLPTGGVEPVLGAGFDSDLTTLANADFAEGYQDLLGYLGSFTGDLGGSSDLLTGLLGDLTGGTAGDGLSFLTGDLGTLLTDLVSGLI
jgi:hypothetical protein